MKTLAVSLGACSTAEPVTGCANGRPAVETQLYFGLSKPHGTVSAREWRDFVAREVGPRFPEGFTVLDARGFWLSETVKRTISEDSKVLIRVHDRDAKDDEAIGAIIENYKRAFAQESVLRVDQEICAAF